MSDKQEIKILELCLAMKNDAGTFAAKYKRLSALCFSLAILCIAGLIVGYLTQKPPTYKGMVWMFLGGNFLGWGILLAQGSYQAKVVSHHFSSQSLQSRINEITTSAKA